MKSVVSLLVAALLCCGMAVAQDSYHSYNNDQSKSSMSQMITNGPVAETVADTNAFIGWSTKQPASSSTLRYGTTRDHMTQTAEVTNNTEGKNHHAKLDNLSPDTTYYFQVIENGQPVGGIGTFRTVETGEKPIQSKAVISQK